MSRQQIEEERWKLSMKFFDYADNPIKEWIAHYLAQEPNDIFDDYSTASDVIVISIDGVSYSVYLSPFPGNLASDTAFHFDPARLKETENLRSATSVLFDAVFTVFPAIINSQKTDGNAHAVKQQLLDVHPKFHNDSMSFSLEMVNRAKYEYEREKENLLKTYTTLNQVKEKLESFKHSDERDLLAKNPTVKSKKAMVESGEELATRMQADLEKLALKVNAISQENILANEKQCDAVNENLRARNCRLYMVLEENVNACDDVFIKKLPVIGGRYEDPYH